MNRTVDAKLYEDCLEHMAKMNARIEVLEAANTKWFTDYWAKVAEKQALEAALRSLDEIGFYWGDKVQAMVDAALAPRSERREGEDYPYRGPPDHHAQSAPPAAPKEEK